MEYVMHAARRYVIHNIRLQNWVEDAHSPAQLISPPLCSHMLYLSKYGAEDAHSPAQLI